MLKIINIDELQPGMMITEVIEQNGPVKIRKVGLVRSADMITGLAEMGVARIEIDLEQSVELEPVPVATSMTQKLLQGEYDHASQVDKSLSDQFNRSLFLPSVSELPSMWQIYAKQAGLALSVVLIGLGLGFAVAWVPAWLNSDSEKQTVAETPPSVTDSTLPNEPEATQNPSESASGMPAHEPNVQVKSQPTIELSNPELLATDGSQPAPEDQSLNELEEGELLTQPEDDMGLEAVSPDLLERFNRALEELESDPAPREKETTVSVVDDLPRVDQLPALTLTRLPSMTFSAHMYSSNRDTRWVRVNGKQLFEGEWIERELQLVNIEPQRVVLSFQGELFTMAALTDW